MGTTEYCNRNFIQKCIAENDYKGLEEVLNKHGATSSDLNHALGEAAKANRTDMVKLLIGKGASPFSDRSLPLLKALMGNASAPLIELLLDRGADVNARGGAPIRTAVVFTTPKTIRLLLDRGARSNDVDSGLRRWALSYRDPSTVAALENGPRFKLESEFVVSTTEELPGERTTLKRLFDFRTKEITTFIENGQNLVVQTFDQASETAVDNARSALNNFHRTSKPPVYAPS